MRNDFEFGILKGRDLGIVGAVIVALAMIAFLFIALHELSTWKFALGVAIVAATVWRRTISSLSSPAEQTDAQGAAECEGKGTQVATQSDASRIDRAKSGRGKQALPPGSAKNAGAMASVARAEIITPTKKQRAARARRG